MKAGMDKATLIGFVVAVIAVLGSVLIEGGNPLSYISPSAIILIIGGSIGVGLISHPLSIVMKIPTLVKLAFKEPAHDAEAMVEQFVKLAERARKEGLLALEQEAASITDPLLKKGITLVVDGTDPELVTAMLEIEVVAREQRHEVGIGLFEALGGFAPTLGIIGTVMGMVHILSNLKDPNGLGASIATAFIATLYGVGTANLFWLPIAGKLKRRSAEEAELSSLISDGVAAIQAGDNPRIVKEKLSGYIGPAKGKKGKAAAEAKAADSTAQAA